MADRQLSMFDGLEYVDDAERPAGEKSCRTCVHSTILRQPKTVPGFPGARLHGYCFKKAGSRYPIYMADSKCREWRER